ncbi:glycoside hydrolase superfamily [Sordaria brevicollis]|uniref:Glycoside hydrolase superfamily n=1 Tax=Sordaria brevicollis TaxID=83679 RepID=A0AAE0NVC7_SORBR|nr:glycoside hydrolase superfamily [Sordaria brevicollis]
MSAFLGLTPSHPSPTLEPPPPYGGTSSQLRPLRHRRPASELPSTYTPYPPDSPCPPNQTMIQGFEWYIPPDFQHWTRLTKIIPTLAQLGITQLWIPPPAKPRGRPETATTSTTSTTSANSTKRALAKQNGSSTTKPPPTSKKPVLARRVDPKDRNIVLDEEPSEIEAWTGYDFPGRQGLYSPLRWSARHFKGIDYDDLRKENAIFKFEGKEWSADVDEENGNYDYLMFADIDHSHPELQLRPRTAGTHRPQRLPPYPSSAPDGSPEKQWFIVGEYWREDSEFLSRYIEYMHHRLYLFDVQLVSNFSRISMASENLLSSTPTPSPSTNIPPPPSPTVHHPPTSAPSSPTLYASGPPQHHLLHHQPRHPTQPTPLHPHRPLFPPLAYSLILLRANAGLPCVFWSDLYGSYGTTPTPPRLRRLLHTNDTPLPDPQNWETTHLRRAGPAQINAGEEGGGAGVAVVMANWWEHASKRMYVGVEHAGECWTDLLKFVPGEVVIDEEGWGVFPVAARSVAVWVNKEAEGREGVDAFELDTDVYGFNKRQQEQVYESQRGAAAEEEPEDWMVSARGAACRVFGHDRIRLGGSGELLRHGCPGWYHVQVLGEMDCGNRQHWFPHREVSPLHTNIVIM